MNKTNNKVCNRYKILDTKGQLKSFIYEHTTLEDRLEVYNGYQRAKNRNKSQILNIKKYYNDTGIDLLKVLTGLSILPNTMYEEYQKGEYVYLNVNEHTLMTEAELIKLLDMYIDCLVVNIMNGDVEAIVSLNCYAFEKGQNENADVQLLYNFETNLPFTKRKIKITDDFASRNHSKRKCSCKNKKEEITPEMEALFKSVDETVTLFEKFLFLDAEDFGMKLGVTKLCMEDVKKVLNDYINMTEWYNHHNIKYGVVMNDENKTEPRKGLAEAAKKLGEEQNKREKENSRFTFKVDNIDSDKFEADLDESIDIVNASNEYNINDIDNHFETIYMLLEDIDVINKDVKPCNIKRNGEVLIDKCGTYIKTLKECIEKKLLTEEEVNERLCYIEETLARFVDLISNVEKVDSCSREDSSIDTAERKLLLDNINTNESLVNRLFNILDVIKDKSVFNKGLKLADYTTNAMALVIEMLSEGLTSIENINSMLKSVNREVRAFIDTYDKESASDKDDIVDFGKKIRDYLVDDDSLEGFDVIEGFKRFLEADEEVAKFIKRYL